MGDDSVNQRLRTPVRAEAPVKWVVGLLTGRRVRVGFGWVGSAVGW
jgi:hypothetical protein